MRKQKNRIIIDSNIWISFLLTRNYQKLDAILAYRESDILISQELIDELVKVTQRDKFKKYFNLNDVESLLLKIRSRAIIVKVTSEISLCRDPKDDFLLSLARDGNATHLITGDKDLLVLEKFGRAKILSVTAYFSEK